VAPLDDGDRRNPVPGFVRLVDDAIALQHDTAQDPVSGLTIAYLGMPPSLARSRGACPAVGPFRRGPEPS
jgi:hypothetical protein